MLQALDEIESDMSVFHRVEDMYTMRADTFFRRVALLPSYDGAVRMKSRHQDHRRVPQNRVSPSSVSISDPWAEYRAQRYRGQKVTVVSAQEMMNTLSKGAS